MKKAAFVFSFLLVVLPTVALSQSSNPVLLSTVSTGSEPYGIYVLGSYAYVTNYGSSTLQIFNISNPASPSLVSTISTGSNPYGVFVSGSYAYVTNYGSSTLQIFNISNPASPSLVSTTSTGSNPYGVFVSGSYVYVTNYGSSTLQIFNISNPASPTLAGSASASAAKNVYVSGSYAYVGESNSAGYYNLQIFNVSNQSSPTLVSTTESYVPVSISVEGNYVYVVGDPLLYVYNISNPASPTLAGESSVNVNPYLAPPQIHALSVQGNYAYTITWSNALLQVFNISTPSPALVGSATVGNGASSGDSFSVFVSGAYAYVLNYGLNTMQVLQVPYNLPTPSCTTSLSPNPSSYSYSGTPVTLTWSFTNATSMYINNVGYVGTASGSTQVPSQQTTDYTCSAGNGVATSTSPTTLTVSAPSNPTVSVSASSTSIVVGQSTNVTADFAAGSGDALTQDNIDEPLNTGLGATTNPDASKTIVFSPSAAGTYTFYARATTDYYSSWTTYATTNVTVAPAPSCTLSLNPTTISGSQSSTLTYSSANATSFSINQGIDSKTPDATSSLQVSPTQTTTYTGTASSGGVQNQCSATVSIACTPAYTCSGSTIQYTNSSCQVSNVATCNSPQFCQAGSSECLAPAITVNPSGNYSGNLQIVPTLVKPGESTQVFWSVSNAQSCSVTGTNHDSWTGLSAPTGGETSSPITAQTTYTLSCTAYDNNPNLTESETVNVTPVYQEK